MAKVYNPKYIGLDGLAMRLGAKVKSGEFKILCRNHNDHDASLRVTEKSGGIAFYCDVCGKSEQANVFARAVEYCESCGVSKNELFRETDEKYLREGSSAPKPAAAKPKPAAEKPKESIPFSKHTKYGDFVCKYEYTDENGAYLYEVHRYFDASTGKKAFPQCVRDPEKPGYYFSGIGGVRRVLYNLPAVIEAIHNNRRVFVVEGEKDVETLRRLGYTGTTCPMGANKWDASYSRSLEDADLYIAGDNDTAGREHMKKVRDACADYCDSIHMVDLASVWKDMPEKGDITDMIEALGDAAGVQAFERAITCAAEVALTGDRMYRKACRTINALDGYAVEEGCVCSVGVKKNTQIADFVALPVLIQTNDDGLNVQDYYKIRGWNQYGRRLGDVIVSSDEFENMGWVFRNWKCDAIISANRSAKEKTAFVIKKLGREIGMREETIYGYTGWREIDGKMCYLDGRGAIGAEGIQVDLGENLYMQKYSLHGTYDDGRAIDGWDSISYKEAGEIAYGMKCTLASTLAVPLLGTTFLAPLFSLLEKMKITPSYGLYLQGTAQVGKTASVSLALCFFGDFADRKGYPNFESTPNAILDLAGKCKDMLYFVDDFHPTNSEQEQKAMVKTASRLIRAIGDRSARMRMNGDLSQRKSLPPKCMVVISGEQLPDVQESGLARYMVVDLKKGDYPEDMDLRNVLFDYARKGYYSRFMRGYIEWLQDKMASGNLAAELYRMYTSELQVEAIRRLGSTTRNSESMAHCMLGYQMMVEYMESIGVLDAGAAKMEIEAAWHVLLGNALKQQEETRNQKPTQMYLDTLNSMISAKIAFVPDITELPKSIPSGTDFIGVKDAQYYFFNAANTYKAVKQYYSRMGSMFPLEAAALYRQLDEAGYLAKHDRGRRTYKMRVGEQMWSCTVIRREDVDGKETREKQVSMNDFVEMPESEIPDEMR